LVVLVPVAKVRAVSSSVLINAFFPENQSAGRTGLGLFVSTFPVADGKIWF
jgi:hypothetical protein